jgi:hypothetical protein
MSSGTKPAPAPSKKTHTLHLNQQALARLDSCLAEQGWPTALPQVYNGGRAWEICRAAANRTFEVPGFEKPYTLGDVFPEIEGEAKSATLARAKAFNTAYEAWQKQPVTVELSERQRECCKEALKFDITSRDKLTNRDSFLKPDAFSQVLLVELGLVEADADE